MDPTTLIPLAGSLARAGLPALAAILGAVVPPPFDLLVKPTFSAVSWALGIDPTIPNAPAAVQAKVDADPRTAQQQLAHVEEAHADAAEEVKAYLADVQNARGMEITLAGERSPVQWGAPVVSAIAISGFVVVAVLVMLGKGGESGSAQLVLGAMITGWTTVIQFWLGSSKGGSDRANQMATMLNRSIANAAPAALAKRR